MNQWICSDLFILCIPKYKYACANYLLVRNTNHVQFNFLWFFGHSRLILHDSAGLRWWPWCEVVREPNSPFQNLSILLDSMFLVLKIKPEKKNLTHFSTIWFWKAEFPGDPMTNSVKGCLKESRIHDTILGLSKSWVAKIMSKSQAFPVEFGRCFLCFRITRPRTNGKTAQKWWNLGSLQFPAADFGCPAVRNVAGVHNMLIFSTRRGSSQDGSTCPWWIGPWLPWFTKSFDWESQAAADYSKMNSPQFLDH